MNENSENSFFLENEMNKGYVLCTNCSSKILIPKIGQFVVEEKALPRMNQKKNSEEVETDLIKECLQVNDIFHFENVGFTNTLNNLKYLTCSDCELGPIGWQNLDTGRSFVALSRVRCVLSLSEEISNQEGTEKSQESSKTQQ